MSERTPGRTAADGAPGGGSRAEAGAGRRSAPRRRPLVVTAAVAALLAGTATAVDLAVEHTARGRIAEAVACRLKPSGPVTAELTSAFAGLRVLTGNLGSAHIAADGVRRDGTEVKVTVDLHDVSTDGTTSGGTATATIAYAELQKRLAARDGKVAGLTVGGEGGGLVLTGGIGGLRLPVTVHTRVTTGKDSLTVTPTTVRVLGRDVAVADLASMPGGGDLAARLGPHTVALPELPDGVTLTGARTDGTGLALALDLARGAAGKDKDAACA
ncbi:LmeA family phospholipid-binding protein [Streptomyces sp. CBMA29]|uniref:LmeA family phospholipid-binding protein n=1 Tax=Streptomyces sp. CBMA29 TaxID=1896314 RepID=UPI001661E625|nr:LmeA family phospholipid-binding protein [Streptomyces sp. CBMA29]